MTHDRLTDRLRSRIICRMRDRGLQPGEPLPGVREVVRETGEDHRNVVRAYRRLEAEGLVEVRGRSGVYVARTLRSTDSLLEGTVGWLAKFLTEAHQRTVRLPDVADLLGRATVRRTLRCGLLASNEDQTSAYAWELHHSFGLHVIPISLPPTDRALRDTDAAQSALSEIDLVVTSCHHFVEARPLSAKIE